MIVVCGEMLMDLVPARAARTDDVRTGRGPAHPLRPPGAALHVSGSLALPVDTMGDTLETLLMRERPRRVITFDPNIRPSLARDEQAVRARLERWLGLADIVKASAEDLAWISPGRPIE